MHLWRVSEGGYLYPGVQLALVLKDSLGIRRKPGVPPKTRYYVQDVRYFAIEHMDVRREAILVRSRSLTITPQSINLPPSLQVSF